MDQFFCSVERVVPELCDFVIRQVENRGAGVKPTRKIVKGSVTAIGKQLRVSLADGVPAIADFCRTHALLSDAT
jgi:hypothetical protein